MIPEDWKRVAAQMELTYGCATLKVDGYDVALQVRKYSALRNCIVPFVNGWSKGEWLTKDCEERRRFMRPQTIALFPPAQRAKLTNGFSKASIKKHFPELDKTITVHHMAWLSFSALKRHLVKNNTSIELVSVGWHDNLEEN